jgi:hypothetical protein
VKTAHRFHRPLVLSSALLLQLACGSDGKDGALDGIPPSLQLLSSNVLGALCENQLECPIAYDDQLYTAAFFVQRPGGDATDNCLAYYATAKTTQRLSRVQQAQERGTVEVDRAQLDRLSSCQVPTEDDSWLVGKVAVRSVSGRLLRHQRELPGHVRCAPARRCDMFHRHAVPLRRVRPCLRGAHRHHECRGG